MNTVTKMPGLRWWRIALAVVCAFVPSTYLFTYLLTTNNGTFFEFITGFLHLEGLLANIVAYSFLFLIPLTIGILFGSLLGRKPRFLHGVMTGILLAIIQAGLLGYIFLYLANP